MAFLDNSGDIILDAVLTDTGRYRLAKGDGSFKIVKFALGDDEINYGSYNKNHASGSAYYDLEILQTPILEAFTNNTSTMKSKLISVPRTNLLYLPMLKLANQDQGDFGKHSSNVFVVAVDSSTVGNNGEAGLLFSSNAGDAGSVQGILNGFNPNGNSGGKIRVDQGLDTTEIPPNYTIDADLNETQYIVEMDNRFGSIVTINGTSTNVSFIDDDNIASYYYSRATDAKDSTGGNGLVGELGTTVTDSAIRGPRGTFLEFKIRSSTELTTSTYMFEQLGDSGLTVAGKATLSANCRYIDTTIKVTGATTGYRIDIPVRFVKKQ
jgi:hypothetical protein